MLTDRIIGALTFRRGVYDDVEKDATFTQTAWIIVAVTGFLNQLGSSGNLIGAIIGTIFAVIGFFVFCWIVNWVAHQVFKADVTTNELVRTLGLARSGLHLAFSASSWADWADSSPSSPASLVWLHRSSLPRQRLTWSGRRPSSPSSSASS